jgi:hypothetical protein
MFWGACVSKQETTDGPTLFFKRPQPEMMIRHFLLLLSPSTFPSFSLDFISTIKKNKV